MPTDCKPGGFDERRLPKLVLLPSQPSPPELGTRRPIRRAQMSTDHRVPSGKQSDERCGSLGLTDQRSSPVKASSRNSGPGSVRRWRGGARRASAPAETTLTGRRRQRREGRCAAMASASVMWVSVPGMLLPAASAAGSGCDGRQTRVSRPSRAGACRGCALPRCS
jgi:hypothetical protein